ncbi:nucleotide exchange factor GrpE [Candidatus Roizmanbacteria bacterium RIFCSPLOWO2_02_FULL_38_10]|uniref:Protein GrpE n=1 Tax=Candidatus Roizmanbacteria bacterium RIFCSPLOWO2_02_FULL_38_10 TaxID=1802074 RepID=A0A1F7JJM7_9BACT|nr:MAG: nucleotide exchange factor GrpE [Candidatus Roizmanbacteria bacterium RIFCSPLOWO2_02_FULL_38_10]
MDKQIKIKPVKEKITAEVNQEALEWKNKYLRALADYHNLEKRTFDQINNGIFQFKKKFLSRFLTVLDNIDRAEVFIKDPGLKLVKDELIKILAEEQVKELDLIGKRFDAGVAECIALVDGDDDGIVKEIVRKGYLIDSSLLRPAQVKVSKKKLPVASN